MTRPRIVIKENDYIKKDNRERRVELIDDNCGGCNKVVSYKRGKSCDSIISTGKALSSSEYMKNKICETLSCNDCSNSGDILKYYGNYEEYKKSLVVNNCFDNKKVVESKDMNMMRPRVVIKENDYINKKVNKERRVELIDDSCGGCNKTVSYKRGKSCDSKISMGKALSSSEYMKNKICKSITCGDCLNKDELKKYYNSYEEYKKSLVVNNCFEVESDVESEGEPGYDDVESDVESEREPGVMMQNKKDNKMCMICKEL